MIGMFWAEKYVMAAGLIFVVRKLFRPKGAYDLWLSSFICTASLISMNLGASLLYPYTREQIFFGVAEGIFAGSALAAVRMAAQRLFAGKGEASEAVFSQEEERITHYTKAFADLAKAFLSVPSGGVPAVAGGTDDYRRMNAVWNERLDEQRVAVAAQLTEISGIMEGAIRRAYETKESPALEKQLRQLLNKKGISLKKAFIYDNEKHKKEVYLTIRTKKKKRCISNKEAAEALSEALGTAMMPSRDARAFVRGEYTNTCFVERTNYEVVYGVERCAGDYQQISGDSFSFFHREEGQFLASLSDGMGTGLNAYQESEKVVDLLEQFLEAGFSKESAVKMINSALVLRSNGKTFSTIDICSIDLYSGVCEFLKIGAATSFIKRGSWVDTITSTSLPAGIFQQTDLEKTCRKLYDGDMLIMVTDGVLDVLPAEHRENLMKDIILEHPTNNPKELADYILNRVRQYRGGRFCDDMTILTVGIWKR